MASVPHLLASLGGVSRVRAGWPGRSRTGRRRRPRKCGATAEVLRAREHDTQLGIATRAIRDDPEAPDGALCDSGNPADVAVPSRNCRARWTAVDGIRVVSVAKCVHSQCPRCSAHARRSSSRCSRDVGVSHLRLSVTTLSSSCARSVPSVTRPSQAREPGAEWWGTSRVRGRSPRTPVKRDSRATTGRATWRWSRGDFTHE